MPRSDPPLIRQSPTLLIMGLSTLTVGLVPGAATIGMAAPLILLTLRLVQGFAVGGEWAGAALLSAESACTCSLVPVLNAETRWPCGLLVQRRV
jgi:hypothetical protein